MSRPRPALAAGLLAAALAGPLLLAASAQAEFAKPAASFRNSVGVNLHTDYFGSPGTLGTWGTNVDVELLQQRLADLGIRRVRGTICDVSGCTLAKSAELQARMVELGTQPSDVRYVLNAGSFSANSANLTPAQRGTVAVNNILPSLAPYVEALEGVNEPPQYNHGGGYSTIQPQAAADAATTQQSLWAARNAHPVLQNAQVLPSAPAAPSATPGLAAQAPHLTRYNAHSYRNIESPDRVSDSTDVHRVRTRVDGGTTNYGTCKVGATVYADLTGCHNAVFGASRKIWLTETGYRQCSWSYEGYSAVQNGVTEAQAAAYLPRQILDAFRLGFERSYLYELIDMESAGTGCAGSWGTGTGRQYAWGLLEGNAQLTTKPAYDALRRTLSVIGDLGSGGYSGNLDLTIKQNGVPLTSAQERHVLLRRVDGSYVLAIWSTDGFRNANGTPNNTWVPTASQPAPPAQTTGVTIGAAGGPWTIDEYRPFSSGAALRTVTAASSITADLTWDVKLYHLRKP